MQYVLTGNFQYDLGVYGLKKILDFFKEDYETDGNFYIELDKKPEEILELIFLYRFYQQKNKFAPLLKKIGVNINSIPIYKSFQNMEDNIKNFSDIKKEFFKVLSLSFQNEFLNLINPSKVKKITTFKNITEILIENVETYYSEKNTCSFCNKNIGFPINKMYFFFSPSHLNAFWRNEVSVYICTYCVLTSLAVIGGFTYFKNKDDSVNLKNSIFIYRPNLADLESLNSNRIISSIGEATKRIIDYEKLKLKKSGYIEDLQMIEFYIDSKNPDLEFYILTEETIKNLIKLENELNKLYTDYKDSLWGQVKDKQGYRTINLSKELLHAIVNKQKLIVIVQRFLKLALMAESFRVKEKEGKIKKQNIPVKGFSIQVLLHILKMHFKLEEELNMDMYNAFKEYGQFLRGRVFSSLSEGGEINWNTFNNKIISLSNSFLDASKGTYNQFMEILTRVMISYDAPIDSNLLEMITKDTYKDIATTIALAVMTRKPGEEIKEKKETVENEI